MENATEGDTDALIGEVAHIVGQSAEGGPRSDDPVPGGDRGGVANLVLLCPTCHTIVDRQSATYTVERLLGIKESHESWVRERLRIDARASAPRRREHIHSALLAVDRMPRYVYTAPCLIGDGDVRARIRAPADPSVMLPSFVQDKLLIAFWPLTEPHGPFADVIHEAGAAERQETREWWDDPVRSGWLVTLLNRALNKLTGRRGLNLDKAHKRYYFEPEREEVTPEGSEPGASPTIVARPRKVTYRPLSLSTSELHVVWQPKKRSTGELRNHWKHRAVGLRFHRVSPDQWVLSLRPEHRFTTDGFTPMVPKATGRRATREKSRMYNIDLLGELQFWRDFLADGKPFIEMNFGHERLVIDAHLLAGEIEWPGVTGDSVSFKNERAEMDLFASAAYDAALEAGLDDDDELEDDGGGSDADLDDWEAEELDALAVEHGMPNHDADAAE